VDGICNSSVPAVVQHERGEFLISTDRARLAIDVIHEFLTNSYWAKGISREVVARSMEHSLCFGVYDGSGAQVGFARVISDFATVAYLGDVFVLEALDSFDWRRAWTLFQVWLYPGEISRELYGTAPAQCLHDGWLRENPGNYMKNSAASTKMYRPLYEADPQIATAIDNETRRQHEGLELIASENFVSEAVLEAAGSVFTNKYAEGYPGRRYYGGCEFADVVENLARDRAKQLFGAEHANVQPHAGSQANMEAYAAVLQPGDTILGLNLAHGGHLTHGFHLNFSGKTYKIVPYGVTKETETIDYDGLEKLAEEHRPKMLIGGGSAYPRIIDFARMREIADSVGALFLVDMAHFAGLVAGGAHPSPVPHAHIVTSTTHKTLRGPRAGMILSKAEFAAAIDKVVFPGMQGGPLMHIIAAKAICFQEAMQPEFRDYAKQVVANAKVLAETLAAEGFRIISGGTDTHLMLVDVFSKGMFGSEAEKALGEAGITVNKNAIPFDANPPLKPSGIRIGTPALTTRGMKEAEMRQVGRWIAEALLQRTDSSVLSKIRGQVLELCGAFPLYAERRARAHAEVPA
jgi:glycine hydroxymethyltransferase